MGTICIFLGLIIFLCSIGGGFVFANNFATSMVAVAMKDLPTGTELYVLSVGIFGFIGLLVCLNLVMHGLTYNKVCKLAKRNKKQA